MTTMQSANTVHHPDDLLPWLANGTLGGAERLEVEAHLATCERCRRELAFLESLREGVAGLEGAEAPGEFGLKRLMQELRRRPQAAARRRWLAPALAASIAVIAIQSAMLANLWTRPEGIVPLGREMTGAVVLQIRFDPRATEADMRTALQAVGATLIDGPGALGIYRVRLSAGVSGQSMDVSQAIASLEARKGVIAQVVAERGRDDKAVQ